MRGDWKLEKQKVQTKANHMTMTCHARHPDTTRQVLAGMQQGVKIHHVITSTMSSCACDNTGVGVVSQGDKTHIRT